MKKLLTILIQTCALCVGVGAASADAPAMLPVQGYLTDTAGTTLDGQYTIKASIYDKVFSGTNLFTETVNAVEVTQGAFIVYLGRTGVPALDLGLFADHSDLWLELTVDGDLIDPRFRLATVPYAALANACVDAVNLGGKPAADYALSSHAHAFTSLTAVPADLADGDDDALGGLSCADGTVATYAASNWTCAPINAAAITTGTLSSMRYNAYDNLGVFTYLDGNDDGDLVVRSVGDTRYLLSSVASSYLTNTDATNTYVAKAASTFLYTVADTDGSANTTTASGHTFCSLSEVRQVGDNGYCQVTKSGADYVLTAKAAASSPTVTCSMRCF